MRLVKQFGREGWNTIILSFKNITFFSPFIKIFKGNFLPKIPEQTKTSNLSSKNKINVYIQSLNFLNIKSLAIPCSYQKQWNTIILKYLIKIY